MRIRFCFLLIAFGMNIGCSSLSTTPHTDGRESRNTSEDRPVNGALLFSAEPVDAFTWKITNHTSEEVSLTGWHWPGVYLRDEGNHRLPAGEPRWSSVVIGAGQTGVVEIGPPTALPAGDYNLVLVTDQQGPKINIRFQLRYIIAPDEDASEYLITMIRRMEQADCRSNVYEKALEWWALSAESEGFIPTISSFSDPQLRESLVQFAVRSRPDLWGPLLASPYSDLLAGALLTSDVSILLPSMSPELRRYVRRTLDERGFSEVQFVRLLKRVPQYLTSEEISSLITVMEAMPDDDFIELLEVVTNFFGWQAIWKLGASQDTNYPMGKDPYSGYRCFVDGAVSRACDEAESSKILEHELMAMLDRRRGRMGGLTSYGKHVELCLDCMSSGGATCCAGSYSPPPPMAVLLPTGGNAQCWELRQELNQRVRAIAEDIQVESIVVQFTTDQSTSRLYD